MTALKKGHFTAENAEKNLGNLCALCGEFLTFFSRLLGMKIKQHAEVCSWWEPQHNSTEEGIHQNESASFL